MEVRQRESILDGRSDLGRRLGGGQTKGEYTGWEVRLREDFRWKSDKGRVYWMEVRLGKDLSHVTMLDVVQPMGG